MEEPYAHIEDRSARITLLMRDADQNLNLAHDVACGETVDAERRKLYRLLYLICREQGRWGDSRIFLPFTGDAELESSPGMFLRNALDSGRVEDALRCAASSGATLSHLDLAKLSAFAEHSRAEGDIAAAALRLAADPEQEKFAETFAKILVEASRRPLRDAEDLALGYAIRASVERQAKLSA